jgi:hypothetical protein
MTRLLRNLALVALLVLGTAAYAGAPPKPPAAITMANGAPLQVVPGGGPLHVEADDQDGKRLAPGAFTWALPAGADIGVQEDATGWLLSAPLSAASGTWAILVQFAPNPSLSPTATVTIGKAITAIKIVVTPQ